MCLSVYFIKFTITFICAKQIFSVNHLCQVVPLDKLFTFVTFLDGCFCFHPRSQYKDSTLTPTPPWQQSLGLVTSSAEQEEGCGTQDSQDEDSRQTDDNNKTPNHTQTAYLENHKVTEETVLSPLLSLECSSYSSPSFAKYPYSYTEKVVGNTPILNTWFSPSPLGHKSSKAKRPDKLTKTFLSSSLAWEDMIFSESLTEFLCEENKDFDIASETEPRLNVQNRKEMAINNLEIRLRDKNLATESTSVCQGNTQATDSHSWILLDITNTPAPNGGDRHDLSHHVCKSPVGRVNKSQARNICSHECNQGDEKASFQSFENEEEQLEGDTYNCSADLFSSSPLIDFNTNTRAETVRLTTEARPLLSKPDKQPLRSEMANVPHSTPDKQKLKSNKCINRDSLIPAGTQDLDFIPNSQSTPIAVVTGSSSSSDRTLTSGKFSSQPDRRDCFYRNLPELDNKTPTTTTSSLGKSNCVRANQLSQCGREPTKENLVWSTTSSRHSHRFTPKRRFWKQYKPQNHLLAQQHLGVQGGALNTGSTGRINHNCDSSGCDVTVCDNEENEVIIVPPTPKTGLSGKLRRRRQTGNSSSHFVYTWEGQQRDGVNCKRTLLDQTLTSSQRGQSQTGHCDSETVDKGSLDDENEACDWSRDLFSDSI